MAGQTAPTLSEDKDSTNDWDCKTKGNFVLQSQYNYPDYEASEVSHHLNDNLIPFRNFGYASLGVEVFLVVDSYVADKGFALKATKNVLSDISSDWHSMYRMSRNFLMKQNLQVALFA